MSTDSDDFGVHAPTPMTSPISSPAPKLSDRRAQVTADSTALIAKKVPFAWLRQQWQVKIVAFIFAGALWFYTAGQVRVTTTVAVSIEESSIVGLPSTHRVANITPREFGVELSGPAAVLRNIRDGSIRPRLELSTRALQDGHQTFAITTTNLGIDAEVSILGVNPTTVEAIGVSIGRLETQEFWIEPPRLLDVPAGVRTELALDRHRVEVTGAIQALNELRTKHPRLRFHPITLTGIDTLISSSDVFTVPLRPDVPEGVVVGEITARITLTPVESRRRQIAIAVQVLAPVDIWRKHAFELAQTQVLVNIQGPSHLVDALDPATVIGYVDLRTVGDLDRLREMPVLFQAPSWLRLEAATVGVTVSAANAANDPTLSPLPLESPEPQAQGTEEPPPIAPAADSNATPVP